MLDINWAGRKCFAFTARHATGGVALQKRIFINFGGLILVCVVLLVVSFGLLFFRAAQTHEMAAIRDKAHLLAELLNQNTDTNYEVINSGDTRITIISADGRALSDSHIPHSGIGWVAPMVFHAKRTKKIVKSPQTCYNHPRGDYI